MQTPRHRDHIEVDARTYGHNWEQKGGWGSKMGSEDRHMVFKAELLRMSMAAELIKNERQIRTLTLGINSQAMLCAIRNRRATPGQYLVEFFHEQIEAVQRKHPGIE